MTAPTLDSASVSTTDGPPQLRSLHTRVSLAESCRALWRRRHFAHALARGELRSRHANTVLGAAWLLLTPLLLTGVYYLLFGILLPGGRTENFIAFLTIGVFVYNFTQRAVTAGAGSIIANQRLMHALTFPRALLPLAASWRETLAFAWSIPIIVGVLVATGERPQVAWLGLGAVLVMQMIFTAGCALLAARFSRSTRDLERVLPFLFRVGFYLSGVLFSVERVISDVDIQRLFALNPMFVWVTLARQQLLSVERWPFPEDLWLSAGIWTVIAGIGGLVVFRRAEHRIGT